ncbi:MAG: hypothetical protein ACT6U0_02290 [Shinella sp.]|uniref:hypothetical protein n=1 Tax=Shinella sp. TaxID=1870904 RepID=UPI0040362C08
MAPRHFFCRVFHQDCMIAKGVNWLETEHKILGVQDGRKVRYRPEHTVGRLYRAEEAVSAHYRALVPCRCFNPLVGQTAKWCTGDGSRSPASTFSLLGGGDDAEAWSGL